MKTEKRQRNREKAIYVELSRGQHKAFKLESIDSGLSIGAIVRMRLANPLVLKHNIKEA